MDLYNLWVYFSREKAEINSHTKRRRWRTDTDVPTLILLQSLQNCPPIGDR
jgi:hypothetical protein